MPATVKGRTIERQVGQFLLRQQVFDFFAGGEFGVHRVIEVGYELACIDGGCGHAQRLRSGGNGRDAVVGRKGDPRIGQAAGDVLVEPGKEAVSWVSRLSTICFRWGSLVRTGGQGCRSRKG